MAARRLKVFQAQFGFYETVVAVASQTAALRAWGTRQNLFASGQARITTDEAAVSAATAHPETVLKRPIGSRGAFEIDPSGVPNVPDAAKTPVKTRARPPTPRPPKPPEADRRDLDRAEAALRALDQDRTAEKTRLRQRQAALDAEKEAAQAAYVERRKAAAARVAKARSAFREAGGRG